MNHHRRLFQSWLKSRKPGFFICFLKLRKKKKKESLIFWILKSLLYLYMIRQATSKFNNPLKLSPGWVTFSGNKKPFTNKVDTQGKFPPLLIPCLKSLKKKKSQKARHNDSNNWQGTKQYSILACFYARIWFQLQLLVFLCQHCSDRT